MKERFKKLMNVLALVIFSIAALWEYMQFYMYYDLPQIVVVLPIIGLLAAVALKKWSFILLGTTALTSIVFQFIEDPQDGLGYVDTSKIEIIVKILPAVLLFLLIGIAAGLLVRVAFRKDRHISLRILFCGLGIIVAFAAGIILFRNPLYPFIARHQIHRYAQKYDTKEYPVSDVVVYYSYTDLQYLGRVVMSDGVIYPLSHDMKTGEVKEERN
ncbi:unknown [Roseburia sp. CAG:309]|nr:unknown [Roseburia sp. CAG:309]